MFENGVFVFDAGVLAEIDAALSGHSCRVVKSGNGNDTAMYPFKLEKNGKRYQGQIRLTVIREKTAEEKAHNDLLRTLTAAAKAGVKYTDAQLDAFGLTADEKAEIIAANPVPVK